MNSVFLHGHRYAFWKVDGVVKAATRLLSRTLSAVGMLYELHAVFLSGDWPAALPHRPN